MRLPRALEPLRHRDFRLLWIGQSVSVVGTFVATVAFPFQVLALGGGAREIAIWSATSSLVSLLFVLFAGVFVDRLPRRTVVLASDLIAGVVAGAIALLAYAGALRIEHLYIQALFFGAGSAFFYPAIAALTPELVPADVLQASNALRGSSRQIGLLAGPLIGGFLVAFGGPKLAFAVDAATFFFSFAALALARPPRREPPPSAPLFQQVREGLAYTFSVPWLWIFIFAWALVLVGQLGPLNVGLPLYVRDVLGGDARLFGVLTAALGAGEVVTGLVLAQVKVVRLGIGICAFSIAGSLAVMGLGLTRDTAVAAFLVAIFGAQFVGNGVLWTTAIQKHVPQHLMGRVMSIDFFGGTLLLPVAPLLFAALVELVGLSEAFVAGGLFATAIVASLLLVPSIRRLE